MTPHWHALQNAGAKPTSPVNARRPGVRQSPDAFLPPIRILKLDDGRPWQSELIGKDLIVESLFEVKIGFVFGLFVSKRHGLTGYCIDV